MAYNRTPKAPTPKPTPAPLTKETAYGRTNYGANASMFPSSIDPGTTVTSPLADNLRQSSDDGEGALDRVIREGTARVDDSITSQLRSIADKNVPDHPAMKGASAGPKIPSKIGG